MIACLQISIDLVVEGYEQNDQDERNDDMELSTSLKVKQVRNVVLGIALILMVGACGGATSSDNPSPRFQVESQQNVAYGPLSDEKLDLCQPIGSAGTRPGILLIHAGGWTQGDKSSFDTLCNRFASQGFVAAAINYRLANSSSPSTQWPAQLVDVQLAVRYLRSRADQLNLDTKRLCAFGTSAGGQLAIFWVF